SGDSYSQTGFNITTGPLPDASNPLGNPTFPGYTTSGGNNWIDNLITEYNLTLMLNYNFAYGGATTDSDLVAPYEPGVLSLIDQTTEFSDSIASHPSTTPWTSNNTLFGVWMGVNDVGNSYYESNVTDILDAIMVVYFDQLQIMYNAGARYFVLLSVPPIQETPFMLAYGADVDAEEAVIIDEYNNLLASNLANFTSTNAGVTAKIVNTTVSFQTAIDDPQAYGAANATCYDDDGTTCLWWNDYHPALAIHKLVAQQVAAAFQGIFFT
ncbi:family 16 carbohydrate esterase, partial [Cryphonectria parasitica EP155]